MSVTHFNASEQEHLREIVLAPRLLFIPVSILGVAYLATGWPLQHWLLTCVVTGITAYSLFCWGSCYHETAHQTLCGSRWLSLTLGRLFGTLMFVPYTAYRETHVRHHAYLNSPLDYELWPYSDPRASLWFRRAFVLFDLMLGSVASPIVYGRIFFSKDSPLPPKVRAAIRYEYLACCVYWAVLLSLVAWTGAWSALFFAWMLPLGIAGTLQSIRKLTEHLGMASYDPLYGTRTVITTDPIQRFLSYVNFDIFVHGIHHRHPRMAHHQLKPTMHSYLERDAELEATYYSSYGRAMLDMVPYLVLNPGVGMNVGAPPPKFTEGAADNFVGDVAREVPGVRQRRAAQLPELRLEVREELELSPAEGAALEAGEPIANFLHYAGFGTRGTSLSLVKVYRDGELLGLAPITKTRKVTTSDLLKPTARRLLAPLMGPFAKNTTYTIDTSFLGYAARTPFFVRRGEDLAEIRRQILRYVRAKVDADGVWVSEPEGEAGWAAEEGFDTFAILPMCHLDVAGCRTYEDRLTKLSKKRRKNARQAQRTFEEGGGTIERIEWPWNGEDADVMAELIQASAAEGWLNVPWEDVYNNSRAFKTAPQQGLLARRHGRIVAFMSFIAGVDTLLQCHGGLDYGESLEIKAYHNLIEAAAHRAIEMGLSRVSLGPLNNETKRRATDLLVPMTGCLWMKNPLVRPANRLLIIPNLQVYNGRPA